MLKVLILDHSDNLLGVTDICTHRFAIEADESIGVDEVGFFVSPQIVVLLTECEWREVALHICSEHP